MLDQRHESALDIVQFHVTQSALSLLTIAFGGGGDFCRVRLVSMPPCQRK